MAREPIGKEEEGVWVDVAPGRKRLVYPSQERNRKRDCVKGKVRAPEMHDVMDAHNERYRKMYGEKEGVPGVIEDYRSEQAKKTWPGYRRIKVGDTWKEGPLPFRSYAEQNMYERTYGFHQYTGGTEKNRRT